MCLSCCYSEGKQASGIAFVNHVKQWSNSKRWRWYGELRDLITRKLTASLGLVSDKRQTMLFNFASSSRRTRNLLLSPLITRSRDVLIRLEVFFCRVYRLPNLLILCSASDEHQRWNEVFEVDALAGAATGLEEPVSDVAWRSLAQHLLHEGILVHQISIRRGAFERFLDSTAFRVRY